MLGILPSIFILLSYMYRKEVATMPISKRYNGKYLARLRFTDAKTKKRISVSKTFALKSDAKKWLIEQKADHAQGKNKSMTKLLWLFDHYYKTYKEPFLRENTKIAWSRARDFAEKLAGQRYVQDVNTDDIQDFLLKYGQTHTTKTIRTYFMKVKEVFSYAVREGYIVKDPTTGVRIKGKDSRDVTYLSVAEIKRLLGYIESHHFQHRKGLNVENGTPYLIYALILTGTRESEMAGLTWDRVDFQHQTITIDRQLATNSSATEFKPTKTKASERTISVPPRLLNVIKPLRSGDEQLVFYNRFNHHVREQGANTCLQSLLRACKITAPGFHVHSLRHSHVALLLDQGIDIYAISKRLGHKDFTTTLKTYAYLIDEKEKKENDKIKDALQHL